MYEFLIILTCLLVLIIGKSITSNWINPGYLMFLYWTLFLSLGFFIIGDNYNWKYEGIIWIIFAILIFYSGSLLGIIYVEKKKKYVLKTGILFIPMTLSKKSWTFLKFIIFMGIIRTFIEVGINGFSIQMFFNLDSLVEMNTTMASKRYGGGAESNVIMQLLLIFVYAAPLCGGYSFVYSTNKLQKLISTSAFIPIILSMLLTNGKAGVIASVCYWTSGFFVAYLEKYKRSPKINIITFFKLAVLIIGIFISLFTSMLLRVGDFSNETFKIIIGKFGTYALGSIIAFDTWFYNKTDFNEYSLGKYTFSFIFEILGFSKLPQGVYEDIVRFPNGTITNIYTVFRGIINDFGHIGSLIFLLLSGIIAGISFQVVIVNKSNSNFIKVVLAAIYFFVFYSLLVSAWTYTSFMIAFIIFLLYLNFNNSKKTIN